MSKTLDSQTADAETLRHRLMVHGVVQGVGFRPFVYRLAHEHQLVGWVNNSAQGVTIEVEGPPAQLEAFAGRLQHELPPLAQIHHIEIAEVPLARESTFSIHHSDGAGTKTALILPDTATCPDCLAEILDPKDRRYRYPFTNCTNCGPRFSIIEALPYDRPNTTMRSFTMCPACQAEYDNPEDRRFHAQPNACPVCGPQLALWDSFGTVIASRDEALLGAADALKCGQIVAVKGLGGFHLMVDARNEAAVAKLREHKRREEKPFALMFPSVKSVQMCCHVDNVEAALLTSAQAPIVLLRRRQHDDLSPQVAPGNPYLGVMLPYTPLHHLLMAELEFPVVATSGNLSDEPICTDEYEALERLQGIADVYLVHNRPITRHVDDSIVRVVAGHPLVMRRARGYAPLPVRVPPDLPPLLAVGAHLKNTVAVATGHEVFVSQHIGDLETVQAYEAFQRSASDLRSLYELEPVAVACDLHPDYASTRYAESTGLPVIRVQHHEAHVLACLAENSLDAPALGISWDGTGYGPDGTVWGGEFLRITADGYERFAHLRAFPLPGGERAVREPRRTALGLLYALIGEEAFMQTDLPTLAAFTSQEMGTLQQMLERGINAPLTTSAGRLFDAAASLLGLRQINNYEGQAAMMLEFAMEEGQNRDSYPFDVAETPSSRIVDWGPAFCALIEDVRQGVPEAKVAARFHHTLVEMTVHIAVASGEQVIALSGGCFQNRYLLEMTIERLRAAGLKPCWHRQVPPNDGGIALGQIIAAERELNRET